LSRATTFLGILLLATSLLGCAQYYWSRPNGSGDDFARENLECARQAAPNPAGVQYGVVFHEEAYRGCLRATGWVREEQWVPPPAGWYRGIE
jgi:hypothetical protein